MANYTQGVPLIADPTLDTRVYKTGYLKLGLTTGALLQARLTVYQWSGVAWVLVNE